MRRGPVQCTVGWNIDDVTFKSARAGSASLLSSRAPALMPPVSLCVCLTVVGRVALAGSTPLCDGRDEALPLRGSEDVRLLFDAGDAHALGLGHDARSQQAQAM